MQIALLADIHGNLLALDTVLAELDRESIDQIVCLGDVVEGGPHPRAVLARLQQINCPIVLGNTDERMRTARQDEPRAPDLPPSYAMELWCVDQLTPADRAFLQTLPLTLNLPLDATRSMLAFHGSPRANTDLLLATTPDDVVAQLLGGAHATILASGHTHAPMVRRYRDMLLVNPGSVGVPVEQATPDGPKRCPLWAEYAVLTVRNNHVSVDLRRTPIALDALQLSVAQSTMPYPERWLQPWLPL